MIRPTTISIFVLAVAACASSGDTWPGGEPAPVYSTAPEPSTSETVQEVEAEPAAETTIAAANEAIEPAAVNDQTAPAGADSAATQTVKRLVTAEYLKEVFDPVKTRSIVPAFDFDDSLVTFEFNSADVTTDSVAQIEQIGKFFEDPQTEGRTFALVGHTDAVGDAAYNLELSKRRAASIKALILQKYPNIYPLISVDGRGEADPKDASAERSRVNRRVVLKEVK